MNKLADKIFKLLELHKAKIKESVKADNADYEFDFEKLKKEIMAFENYTPKKSLANDYLFLTNGNPYTTVILICYAVFNNVNVTIDTNRELPTLNKLLVDIFNDLTYIQKDENDYRSGQYQIVQSNHLTIKQLIDLIDKYKINDIYVVDDYKKCQQINSYKLNGVYLPIFSIDLYSNSKKYRVMETAIEEHCQNNYININIYNNEDDNAIILRSRRADSSNGILLLANKEAEAKLIALKIKNKKVYINYNPFDTFETDMVEYFIKY